MLLCIISAFETFDLEMKDKFSFESYYYSWGRHLFDEYEIRDTYQSEMTEPIIRNYTLTDAIHVILKSTSKSI